MDIQRFQNWLHRYDAVLIEGINDFGGGVPGTRLGPMRAVRGRNGGGLQTPFLGAGAQAKVAAVLTDNNGIQAPRIAELAGIPSNRVQAVLARMHANGTLGVKGKRGKRTYWLKGAAGAKTTAAAAT